MSVATAATPTPADLTIVPRDLRFGRDETTARWWHGGDPFATALYNALSATFPKGEAFFIESVRRYIDSVPERLREEIGAFTTQEVIHSREHAAFNRRAVDSGYELSKLDARIDERLALIRSKPPIASLAATMVLEHYTAILAHELLAEPRHLAGADRASADLWRWHAAEEIEHKGVAYDTWLAATADWPRFKRWQVKAKVMLLITSHFFPDRLKGAAELLRQDGITGVRAWAGLLRYAFFSPGVFRKILGAWASFFMPRFHPWNHDDRALIAEFDLAGAYAQEPTRKVRRARAAA
ncbi:metal-dependent hydrolase [Sphingomonas mesophila]|uniref:metal-dependent hydrolase n=1 Tax=Sphingomonas mesophila TaxID=2303576 RepID=UPI000E590002|nr:metal-dependent hydrolase [Sphingomonas mesophila]